MTALELIRLVEAVYRQRLAARRLTVGSDAYRAAAERLARLRCERDGAVEAILEGADGAAADPPAKADVLDVPTPAALVRSLGTLRGWDPKPGDPVRVRGREMRGTLLDTYESGGIRKAFVRGVGAADVSALPLLPLEPDDAGAAAKAAPPDPDAPRRFRWPVAGGGGEWNYGCYFPKFNTWCAGRLCVSGRPDRKGVVWIDPEPTGAKP